MLGTLGGRTDLDAHAHVFLQSDPMAAERRYEPGYDAPLEAWAARLLANGLAGGILVQPSFLGTENARLISAIREARERGLETYGSAVVPESVGLSALEELARAGIVSLRLNVIGRALPELASAPFQAFVGRMAEAGLGLELHAEPADVARAIERLGNGPVPLVIDHYARARSPEALRSMLDGAPDGVMVKASAPYRIDPSRAEDGSWIGEMRAALRETIGMGRILYGSDWPHTQFEHVASFGATFPDAD